MHKMPEIPAFYTSPRHIHISPCVYIYTCIYNTVYYVKLEISSGKAEWKELTEEHFRKAKRKTLSAIERPATSDSFFKHF